MSQFHSFSFKNKMNWKLCFKVDGGNYLKIERIGVITLRRNCFCLSSLSPLPLNKSGLILEKNSINIIV